MCFSAEASFTASIALALITVFTYRQVHKKRDLLLVGIPALFAVQQFCEGLVWLSYNGHFSGYTQQILIYGFLFFAYLFWPTYLPLALLQLERVAKIRGYLKIFSAIGLSVSLGLLVTLLCGGATAQVMGCQIVYQMGLQVNSLYSVIIGVAYLTSTVGAMLVSTMRGMRILGISGAIAYGVALYFYYTAFVSVWCFFAAILSLMVYWIVRVKRR